MLAVAISGVGIAWIPKPRHTAAVSMPRSNELYLIWSPGESLRFEIHLYDRTWSAAHLRVFGSTKAEDVPIDIVLHLIFRRIKLANYLNTRLFGIDLESTLR